MTHRTFATLVLAVLSMLLAIGFFVAGAMWRAHTTSGRGDIHGLLHVRCSGLPT